jgi:hypothetical protein
MHFDLSKPSRLSLGRRRTTRRDLLSWGGWSFSTPRLLSLGLFCAVAPSTLAATSGTLSLTRAFDKALTLTNAPIVVTATLTSPGPDTIRGFYYYDQVPTGLVVSNLSATLSGRTLTNASLLECGLDGDILTGCTPWRWRLETPTNFAEANPMPPQGIVRIVYSITCSSTGTFSLREFGCAACKPDKTNSLYDCSVTNDQQTVSFVTSLPPPNTAPVLPSQTNRTILELTALNVSNTATDADLPANMLSYSLVNPPAGATIDTNGLIVWTADESQGPGAYLITTVVADNGSPPLSATNTFMITVSEVNTAPTLPAQTNRTIIGLQSLTVTNTGKDTDLPANPLQYTLQGPPGATIDANGVIRWQPTAAQVPSTNLLTTVVQDTNAWDPNASQLSATNSFIVVVRPAATPPMITSLFCNKDQAVITWSSTPGSCYRLQFVLSLGETNWNDVQPDVTATGPSTSVTNEVGPYPHRSYRVLLVAP